MRDHAADAEVVELCDVNRLQILEQLRSGEKCSCVLLEKLQIGQSTLSYHMKILCDSGVVVGRAEGKWTHYGMATSEAGSEYARELLEILTRKNTDDSCGEGCGGVKAIGWTMAFLLDIKSKKIKLFSSERRRYASNSHRLAVFQDQILGMKWLNALIGSALEALGISLNGILGGALQFFLYDTIKIFVLLSVLIFGISYIQSYFPPERTKQILGRFHGIGANTAAALLGTVTPFCSCSSIPLFMGFTSAGLPVGVTLSFLISSPMVDLGSLVLLMSIFGARVAVLYVLLGLVIAVVGGTLLEKLGMERYVEDFIRNAPHVEIQGRQLTRRDRVQFAREQLLGTIKKVAPYIFIGVGIGALIHNVVPQEWVEMILGSNNPFAVILATLVGVPMYADIFGTIPVAESLLFKGAGLGTILSFMMAVTTLSLPSMIMLKKAVKPQLLAAFIAICTLGIILVGYFFNAIQFLLV